MLKMRRFIVVLALVTTASVSASILPPPIEKGNNALLAAQQREADNWFCSCFPHYEDGVDNSRTSACCTVGRLDTNTGKCANLEYQQAAAFPSCCGDEQAICGYERTPSIKKPSAVVDQPNPVEIARREDDKDTEWWCYCDSILEYKDDSQTDSCCPIGHYDIDLLVCGYLQPRDVIDFEECCAEQEVVCRINGTDPNKAIARSPPSPSIDTFTAGITPAPSTTIFHEHELATFLDTLSGDPSPPYRGPQACFVGSCCPPVKYLSETEECCPEGHYDPARALCLDMNKDQVSDFKSCLMAFLFYSVCINQLPDWVTVGPQGPGTTFDSAFKSPLRLRAPPSLVPGHLHECYAGRDLKSKDDALTKKCCPGGYYNEDKEVCQNMTPSGEEAFLQCLPHHVTMTCVVQKPKAAEGFF